MGGDDWQANGGFESTSKAPDGRKASEDIQAAMTKDECAFGWLGSRGYRRGMGAGERMRRNRGRGAQQQADGLRCLIFDRGSRSRSRLRSRFRMTMEVWGRGLRYDANGPAQGRSHRLDKTRQDNMGQERQENEDEMARVERDNRHTHKTRECTGSPREKTGQRNARRGTATTLFEKSSSRPKTP